MVTNTNTTPNHDKIELGAAPRAIALAPAPPPLRLSRWLYCSDIHAPLHSELWIERLARVGQALEVADLIIGGDLCDFDSLSNHPADLPQSDLNLSIEVTGQVLRYLKSAFTTVYVLPGNHDRRLAKKLDKHLSFTYLVKMLVGDTPGIVATDNDFFHVDSEYAERAGWSVGHPRFFSAYPTKGLDQVALQRQCHVIGAHSHTLGASKIGPYWCISPGHLMRPDLTPYLTRSAGLSKHADQSPGFVMVEHEPAADVVTLFADGFTRWSDYD